jgi:hypothetical protein
MLTTMASERNWYTVGGSLVGRLAADGIWIHKDDGRIIGYLDGDVIYRTTGTMIGRLDSDQKNIFNDSGEPLGFFEP